MSSGEQKTILLVEDEAIIAITGKKSLEQYGYNVITANSGEKAIDLICNKNEPLDLILMDIDLGSGIDGTEAAEAILKVKDIPVVFLSSHTEPEVVEKTEKITSYGYVVKASSITVLDASIKMAFKLFDAHMKLKKSEDRLQSIFDNVPIGMFQSTKEGKFLNVNKALPKILRYDSQEELMEKINSTSIAEALYVDPPLRSKLVNQFEQSSTGWKVSDNRYYCKDGSIIDAILTFSEQEDIITGQIILNGFVQDITDQKRAEEVLRQREGLLSKIFDVLPVGLWLADKNGNLTRSNAKGREIWGAEPLVGQEQYGVFKARSLPSGKELAPQDWALAHTIQEGVTVMDEMLEIDAFDGRKKVILNYTAPIPDKYGEVDGAIIVNLDITERKLSEDEVKEKNDELTAANEELEAANEEVIAANQSLMESEKKLIESELQFRNMANAGLALIWRSGTDKLCNYFNDPWLKFTGRTIEQEMGNGWTEGVHPDDFNHCLETYVTAFDKRKPFEMEYRLRHASGQYRIVLDMGTPNFNSIGEFTGYIGHCFDITEWKQIEEDLRETKNYLENLVNYANAPIIVWDTKYRITKFNRAFERISGRLSEKVIGKHVDILFPVGTREQSLVHIQDATVGNRWDVVEIEIEHVDGAVHTLEWNSAAIYTPDGEKITSIIAQGHDITIRKHLADELKKSESKYRSLFENVSDAIFFYDPDTFIITEVNDATVKLYGYEKEELIGMSCLKFSAELEKSKEAADKIISEGGIDVNFRHHKKKDGTDLYLHLTGHKITVDGKVMTFSVCRDVTERKQTEDALRESRQLFAFALQAGGMGVWDWYPLNDKVAYSDDWAEMLEYRSDEIEHHVDFFKRHIHPDDQPAVLERLMGHVEGRLPEYVSEHRLLTKFGKWKWILDQGMITERNKDGHPVRVTGVISDITERKLAEEKIKNLLAEKEIILKEVHHRVKNNMNTVYGLLFLQSEAQNNVEAKSILLDAAGRVQSMGQLYDKLYRSENINEISIREYLPPFISEIISVFPQNESVKIETDIDDVVLSVKFLSSLGIIMNELITNSMKYAFTGGIEGIITVEAYKNENQVTIVYKDNGHGIPESVTFENSTGFGLSLVRMLVEQIEGSIKIERGDGTGFIIEFAV